MSETFNPLTEAVGLFEIKIEVNFIFIRPVDEHQLSEIGMVEIGDASYSTQYTH
jgi:hypothetical protein